MHQYELADPVHIFVTISENLNSTYLDQLTKSLHREVLPESVGPTIMTTGPLEHSPPFSVSVFLILQQYLIWLPIMYFTKIPSKLLILNKRFRFLHFLL